MAVNAGQRITAGMLSWDADGTTLTNDTSAAADTWEDWGTETVQFDNPGVDVTVLASLFGRLLKTTAGTRAAAIRVAISLDGGTTFDFGVNPFGQAGDDGAREPISTGHVVTGAPTGSIIIKAQLNTSGGTDVDFRDGFLQAQITPQT